eukprot:2625092-Prymnesium_polylepis.1
MYQRVRPREITDWLRNDGVGVENFVAIDDRNLVEEEGGTALKGRAVLTQFGSGLTQARADDAIRILRDPSLHLTGRPAAASKAQAQSTADVPLLTSLTMLLEDAELGHLTFTLRDQSLRSMYQRLAADGYGRTDFLQHLRTLGISNIGDRQAIANALSKAKRQGRVKIEIV